MVLKVVVEVLEKSLKELEFNVQITVGTLCSVEFHKGLCCLRTLYLYTMAVVLHLLEHLFTVKMRLLW